uniref:Uncharacterized protein n=1 Tax=Aegilops tauschii TaxID=37682 RepID=M8AIW7_AEGTA
MASPEPSAGGDAASQSAAVQPLQLPTPEEIKGQEMMNNCAVRSVLSGVMAECVVEKVALKLHVSVVGMYPEMG